MPKKKYKKVGKTASRNPVVFGLFIATTAVILVFVFSFLASSFKSLSNPKAYINCRNYKAKYCPTSSGCRVINEKCVTDPYYFASQAMTYIFNNHDVNSCIKDTVIQAIYYGKSSKGDYTAARVATGISYSSKKILSGGVEPQSVTSNCQVKFATCYGKTKPGENCNYYSSDTISTNKCENVCKSQGDHWCKIYWNETSPLGCYENKYAEEYNTITTNWQDSNNLWSCDNKNHTDNITGNYHQYQEICCEYGCEDINKSLEECRNNYALFSDTRTCRRKSNNSSNCNIPCLSNNNIYYQP